MSREGRREGKRGGRRGEAMEEGFEGTVREWRERGKDCPGRGKRRNGEYKERENK